MTDRRPLRAIVADALEIALSEDRSYCRLSQNPPDVRDAAEYMADVAGDAILDAGFEFKRKSVAVGEDTPTTPTRTEKSVWISRGSDSDHLLDTPTT